MSITYIPPRVPSVEGFLKEDGTVPLTGIWNTGNYNIIGPSAIYTSSTAPSAPYRNMLWNDTSISTRIMIRRWSGSAWQVVYGYETAPRTVSLVHDHGALLTSSLIRDAINEIGTFSAPYVVASVEIENKTLKNFVTASAVDAGSGKVKLPLASGHGFLAGEIVCIDGTTNYDGIYTIDSVEDGCIVVSVAYASETIPSSAIVRVVISSPGTAFPPKYIKINMFAKGFSQTRDQMKSVVLYAPGNTPCCHFTNWAMPSKVQGIKFVSPNGSSGAGFYIQDSSKIDVEYCAFSRCLYYAACANTHSSVSVTQSHFKSCSAGAIAAFNSATILSSDNESVLPGEYGLYATLGGTIKKTSAQQPTGTVANEYANTSKAGQII